MPNDILLDAPMGEVKVPETKSDKNYTLMLFNAISAGKLSYDSRALFYDTLKKISGTVDPCEEREARALYSGMLWGEFGSLAEKRYKKLKEPLMADILRGIVKMRINFDLFFDGYVERIKPVYFAYGKSGEVDKWDRDTRPDAKIYWYCPQEEAAELIKQKLGGKVDEKRIKHAIEHLQAGNTFTVMCGENEIEGGPCFRDHDYTERFSGRGNPNPEDDTFKRYPLDVDIDFDAA